VSDAAGTIRVVSDSPAGGLRPATSAGSPLLPYLQMIQRDLAVVGRRAKDPAVHEALGASVGYPLDGPYYGTIARIGRAEGCTLTELAELLGCETSTVSRRVRVLEDRGLVERDPDANDGRSWRLHLSAEGRRVFEALDRGWVETIAGMFEGWTPDEIRCFAEQFDRFASAFDAHGQRASVGGLTRHERRPRRVPQSD
jgi:DNA-binding MarR family transcriptional regulator